MIRMRMSIYWKLTLSFMLVAFTTAVLVALFIRLSSADRLTQLIVDQQRGSLQQTLAEYYMAHGSWDGVAAEWGLLERRMQPTPNAAAGDHAFEHVAPDGSVSTGHVRPSFLGLADAQGIIVVPVDPHVPSGSQASSDVLQNGTPVLANGRQVGTILVALQRPGLNPAESLFLRRTSEALVLAMLGALCVALLMGILLARTIAGPLRALTVAAQSIGQGQVAPEVRVTSSDELGQLATAFNRMSREVVRANQLRRQMTADVAHDLRTPLTVIGGYVEAMRDEVLAPTPARLALIYSEIERLQNLVGDLRTISQADAGELPLNRQRIPPEALLKRVEVLFRHEAEQQGVTLSVEAGADLPEISIDEARMIQVMGNLLCNSLRYTPAGGSIILGASAVDGKVEIAVRDSGTGIAPEELPFIFDRFYRADKSRNTETGESGLGLAIVKALVESHGGHVHAESLPGQGTCVRIELPV